MVIFNSFVSHYQRVIYIGFSITHPAIGLPPLWSSIQRIQRLCQRRSVAEAMPRVLGLPEVHGSLLWGYSNWMAYGQSYRDTDDWEPLFTILGHLHIETQKIAEDPCGSGRDALPKHWPKCLSWSERQCRIVGQRREASNGWWAAKDSLRTLRKAKSWTCWGVASQTHPESPKRTQNLLLVSSPIFTCRDDWAQI